MIFSFALFTNLLVSVGMAMGYLFLFTLPLQFYMTQLIFLGAFFVVLMLGMLWDLGVFSKTTHDEVTAKQALKHTAGWFSVGLAMTLFIYWFHANLQNIHGIADLHRYQTDYKVQLDLSGGFERGLEDFSKTSAISYLSGFLLEYALSIDNLFVILLIFQSFKMNGENQKRILIWGVIGAVILRFLFIYLGSEIVSKFEWVMYLFGAFLVYSGFKMLRSGEDETMETDNHVVVRYAKKWFRVAENNPAETRFFIRDKGQLYLTIPFLVLIIVDITDVVFAVDSVPAVFGVTRDPYLVFFSNIFAVMGLRSLYFLLGAGMDKFYSLKYGLSMILVYIGLKMLLEKYAHMYGFNEIHNLLVIISILALSIFWSIWFPKSNHE
jgi:tellurite resistance protein TerC